MNARLIISANLVVLALILVVLPEKQNNKGYLKPLQQIELIEQSDLSIDIDVAARYLNNNDTIVQFIDVRNIEQYTNCNIPGAINIPYADLLNKKWQGYLNQKEKINILYSNDNLTSNLAYAILEGKGYTNIQVLKGGLNEWFNVVMNTEFKGGRLTARENALYENRRKAKELFTEINSLPDSLKNKFLEAKLLKEAELDGGCE